jgi:hypothetical protein
LWLVVQMQQLQHEITRMRAQQDSLKKKIKETTEKFEDEHDMHLKNMAALKKESENQMKHVRELEVQVPYKGRVTVSACLLPFSPEPPESCKHSYSHPMCVQWSSQQDSNRFCLFMVHPVG